MRLFTIGYEKAPQAAVIARLRDAGVHRLIDVRAIAASRRVGFSKTVLSSSLADAGIEYVHLRALGTPKAGREAARKGRISEMRSLFERHLSQPDAVVAFKRLKALVEASPSALLCFEAIMADVTGRFWPSVWLRKPELRS